MIAFATTGATLGQANHVVLPAPHPYDKYVLAVSISARLPDPSDRKLFDEILERKFVNIAAGVDDLTAGLGPDGSALWALVDNRDPEHVDDLLARLAMEVRDELSAIDLSTRDLNHLDTHLILIHGRGDRYIPFTESHALAAAMAPGQTDVYVVDSLDHVDLALANATDVARLWWAMDDLLSERVAR